MRITKLLMRVVLEKHCPPLLEHLKLSNSFVSNWVREELNFTWRLRTTAAQKLPLDWRTQGMYMAKRIAGSRLISYLRVEGKQGGACDWSRRQAPDHLLYRFGYER